MKEWSDAGRDDEGPREVSGDAPLVRRALVGDWRALKAIRLEALSETPEAFGSTYADAVLFGDERWRSMIERQCYFLAFRDDAVLGMASGGLNDDYPGTHWLYGMYVTPSARGGDTAPMLADAVMRWARGEGAGELYLHVAPAVVRARAFYERVGFTPTGVGHVMHRDPSVVLDTMSRSLDDV